MGQISSAVGDHVRNPGVELYPFAHHHVVATMCHADNCHTLMDPLMFMHPATRRLLFGVCSSVISGIGWHACASASAAGALPAVAPSHLRTTWRALPPRPAAAPCPRRGTPMGRREAAIRATAAWRAAWRGECGRASPAAVATPCSSRCAAEG